MKTIGLIGGLSWHSTITYYTTINQLIAERLGNSHSAKIILYSVDFNEFFTIQESGGWKSVESMLTNISARLESAGADCILLCTNTPHVVADVIQENIGIPLLHIAEATAEMIKYYNINKVGLLGTKFTMEHPFFHNRLKKYGIDTIIPDTKDREFIHGAIFNEMTRGIFKPETKQYFLEVIENLCNAGAGGIIFGCTEIPLLIEQSDIAVKAFDTADIHARAAVEFALNEDEE
jgi:aspartate racemase